MTAWSRYVEDLLPYPFYRSSVSDFGSVGCYIDFQTSEEEDFYIVASMTGATTDITG